MATWEPHITGSSLYHRRCCLHCCCRRCHHQSVLNNIDVGICVCVDVYLSAQVHVYVCLCAAIHQCDMTRFLHEKSRYYKLYLEFLVTWHSGWELLFLQQELRSIISAIIEVQYILIFCPFHFMRPLFVFICYIHYLQVITDDKAQNDICTDLTNFSVIN